VEGAVGFVWIAVLAVLFWFLLIRPQRRARQQASAVQGSLSPGDEVVTIGGIIGTIVALDDDTVDLDVADDVVMTFTRRAIVGPAAPPSGWVDEDADSGDDEPDDPDDDADVPPAVVDEPDPPARDKPVDDPR